MHPVLYEINTRCWLRDLSERLGVRVTLADVPDSEFANWQRLGFTHIWLMGVWTMGPRARERALASFGQTQPQSGASPAWPLDDIQASPYAIADYHVSSDYGGDDGLAEFRRRLNARGMKLFLDFVPNHVGLDHPWLEQRPELFVQSPSERPETFLQQTLHGPRWLAYGKDPYWSAWTDTVQLDYRVAETRAAMTELLQSVAVRCDGVRCDMAMLILEDVFYKTWQNLPAPAPPQDSSPNTHHSDFWTSAIPLIKQTQPGFLFLAEVYWGLEGRLQSLGFDYTYDKELYDRLVAHDAAGVQRHVLSRPLDFVRHSAHFIENHDERRIASILSPAEQFAAAAAILLLPGMRFLHEGQLSGAKVRLPVQISRRPPEPETPAVRDIYEQLLPLLKNTAVGKGAAELLRSLAAWPENPTAENFILIKWQCLPTEFDLVAINLARHRAQCIVPLTSRWELTFVSAGSSTYEHRASGLFLDFEPHAVCLLRGNDQT